MASIIMAIIDEDCRVVSAQFGAPRAEDDGEEVPSVDLLSSRGQRPVRMDVPGEVEQMSGPELARFFSQFSELKNSWLGTIEVPRVEAVRRPRDPAGP